MNLGSWGYRRKCKPESVQLNCFYSVAKSCLALCNPMNSGTQARFLRPSPPPGVCSNARPSSVEINVQSESHEPQVFLPSSLLVMPCATLTSNFTNYPTPELQIFNHYNETGGKQAGRAQPLKEWHSPRTPHKLMGTKWVQDGGRVNFIRHWRSVQFSCSVMSDSLQPHGLQHARPPCPLPTPRVYSNSCPLSRWCHPTISSSL